MRGGRWVHSLEADERPTVVDPGASLEEEAEIAPTTGETSDEDESDVTSDNVAGIAAGLSSDDDDIKSPLSSGLSWIWVSSRDLSVFTVTNMTEDL